MQRAITAPIQAYYIGLPKVSHRTGLSGSTIKREVKEGRFPAPVRIGERRVAWVSVEVDAWCDERLAARDNAAPKMRLLGVIGNVPPYGDEWLATGAIVMVALMVAAEMLQLLLRWWRAWRRAEGDMRPAVGDKGPRAGATVPALVRDDATGSLRPKACASPFSIAQPGSGSEPGRTAPRVRVHVARIAPQAFVEVTGEGATCPVPKSIIGSNGNACANPSAFFITSTVVAPGHRLWFMDAYHAYQSDAWKHGLSSVPMDQFGRAATNLGFARGKASSRYFRDRALRLEPPSPPTTNPNGNIAEDKLCAFNQRKITE